MSKSQHQQIVDLIIDRYPTASAIYLFGSRATGQHTLNSDWDIALLTTEKCPPLERWEMSESLSELLNSQVDLVELLQASTALQMQIINDGKILFHKQPTKANFEMQVFSMYGRLQESRGEIIAQFISETKNA